MKLNTIGLDLAKDVLQVHGVDEHGKTVLKKALKRAQVLPFFVNLTPCPRITGRGNWKPWGMPSS